MAKDCSLNRLSIEDLSLKDKKVLMRVDFNVPLDDNGHITDASRIKASLPSIRYILGQGGSLILMSHLGRPKNIFNKNLSLTPCAQLLSSILQIKVKMAPDCVGYDVQEMVNHLKPGEVMLLENLRFHRAEEHPDEDPDFSKKIASFGDVYVNEAFGSAHRKHSSIYIVPQYFPDKAAAGYLMEKEMHFLDCALTDPQRPFVALIGGAKVSTKLGLLRTLVQKVDSLLIGGKMSYTFLKAAGMEVGGCPVEIELISQAKEILDLAHKKKINFILPADLVIAKECSNDAETRVQDLEKGIPQEYQGYDIGPKTLSLFANELNRAKTIVWNGPVGVYELDKFAHGSKSLARIISQTHAITIVGGGDSIAVINAAEVADLITHISTGGGATLEFIEQGTLPGIEALSPKKLHLAP